MAKKSSSNESGRTARQPEAHVEGETTLDVEALRQIVQILESSDVSRLVWRKGRERLFIRRDSAVMPLAPLAHVAPPAAVTSAPQALPPAPAPAPASPPKPADNTQLVTSPFVGTFYRSPSPDQAPFADVGTMVKKGQALCIIEAMKLMNEIESEVSGKVVEILVQNGQPVEFGQALFRIAPA
jgi:acetyl-CoA carboxylase biotin carboxyl carrier protein